MPVEPTFAPREALFSDEAERAIIGAAVYDVQAAVDAVERLTPAHFADQVHARIWKRVLHLAHTHQSAAPYHVRDGLGADDGFEEWGGVGELMALQETADLAALAQNIDTVVDRAVRRRVRQLARETEARAADTARGSGDALLAELEAGAADIAHHSTMADAWIGIGDAIDTALRNAEERNGRIDFPFGVPSVDAITNGMHGGESTVIAAWTGMGKTLAALHTAVEAAKLGLGVCYLSLEMEADPLAIRVACSLAFTDRYDLQCGPTVDSVVKNDLGQDYRRRLWQARQAAKDLPLYIDRRPGRTVDQLEATVRRQHRKWERAGVRPGPVYVDHLGKVKPAERYRGDRTAETEEASHALDAMAKRLGVPVVPLVQLNRQTEQQAGSDKRPTLTSLKQSGAIAENARQVVFIYRPEYYFRPPMDHEEPEDKADRQRKLEEVRGHLYWVVAKNSHGPIDQVKSWCDASRSVIREWPGG